MNTIKKVISVVLFLVLFVLTITPINMVSANVENIDSLNDYPLVSGAVYYIKNKYSGKYLNVNFGTDANGTNVNQWS